jgi:hypothetical protein
MVVNAKSNPDASNPGGGAAGIRGEEAATAASGLEVDSRLLRKRGLIGNDLSSSDCV